MLIMLTSSWQNGASSAKLDVLFLSLEGSSCDDNHRPKHQVRVIPRQPHFTHINLNMGEKFNLPDFPAIEQK